MCALCCIVAAAQQGERNCARRTTRRLSCRKTLRRSLAQDGVITAMLAKEDERYQGVQKHSSGFKLLASMGWKEGEGLVSNTPCDTSFLAAHYVCRWS